MNRIGRKHLGALWRLAMAGLVTVLLLIVIANAITQPVDGGVRSYTAEFTDVSGLRTGADVRINGVRVGKVELIRLERKDGRSLGAVDFTLEERYNVGAGTRFAIRYQALTGERYVEVKGASVGAPAGARVQRITTAMTQPSFDITTLFNGLQPVLATLSPEEINTFSENTVSFLSGDGNGLGPMLDSIRRLTSLVSDRQQVVAALMHNLAAAAQALGGNAPQFMNLLEWMRTPIDAAMSVLDEFRKSSVYGPAYVNGILKLLDAAGIKPGINIDDALDRAITNVHNSMEAFKRLPVLWQNIEPPSHEGVTPVACSQGPAVLPPSVEVLLNGQKVVLCKN